MELLEQPKESGGEIGDPRKNFLGSPICTHYRTSEIDLNTQES